MGDQKSIVTLLINAHHLLLHYRWALFPPSTPKEILKVPTMQGGNQKDEAIMWFSRVYPETQLPSWPREYVPVSESLHSIWQILASPKRIQTFILTRVCYIIIIV